MDNSGNGFKSKKLLDETILGWKNRPRIHDEIRVCNISSIPKMPGELKLELSIAYNIVINGNEVNISVKADPFFTATLAIVPRSMDYKDENNRLKILIKNLEENFSRSVALESARHTPQNDL